MTYATLAQVKSALRLPATDTVDDAALELNLAAADEAINAYCGRTFSTAGTVDTTRYYAVGKPDYVEIDDCTAITTVEYTDNGVDWTATTEFQPEPLNSFTDGLTWPYTRIRRTRNGAWPVGNGLATVRVTGKFAFGSVPSSITQASVLQTIRWFKRADAPFGVAGFGDVGAIRVGRQIDPDVEVLLQPYRRYRSAL